VKESSSDFRDTLLELIDSSPAPADHPSPDRWLAYHRGELAAEEEESLQEHLVRCRDCFDLSAAAAAFAQPEEEQGAGGEMETAAQWRLLRPQLDPPPANVRELFASPRRQPAWKNRFPSTVAASFFVALVGLSGWSLHQRSELEAARAPKPVSIVEFEAPERSSTSSERILSTADAPWTFVFHPVHELKVYRLTLRDAGGKQLGSYKLRPDEDSALTILVPELPPGDYSLQLSDDSGKVLKNETQSLRVTEPGQGG
jgi:hypothetical protein